MTAIFIIILNMSITASVVALVAMLVRIPLKKAPKIFSYALWGVVLFRLVCPFSIESNFSLMPTSSNTIPQDIIYSETPAIQTGVQLLDIPINAAINNVFPLVISENNSNTNPTNNTNSINIILQISGYVWLFGFFVLMLCAAIGYIRLKRRVYYATLVRDNIFETDKIKTPFVLGFIRPKIYMPLGIELSQHDYILKHEQTHIRRRDYLIKPFAFVALALHWFNPIMWLTYFFMAKDMEMSCDESVLEKANGDIRGDYSYSLFNLSVKRSNLISPLAFSESNIKSRIKNVLNFKKHSRLIMTLAATLVIAVLIGGSLDRVSLANQSDNGNGDIENLATVSDIDITGIDENDNILYVSLTFGEFSALRHTERIKIINSIDWSKSVAVKGSFREITVDDDGMLIYSYGIYDENGILIHSFDSSDEVYDENGNLLGRGVYERLDDLLFENNQTALSNTYATFPSGIYNLDLDPTDINTNKYLQNSSVVIARIRYLIDETGKITAELLYMTDLFVLK